MVIYIRYAPEGIGGNNHHHSKHRQRTRQWPPAADTQDDNNSTIGQVVESDGNSRDPEPTVMGYEEFPMDAAPRMETGNSPAPSPQPSHPSRLEVTETPTEMTAVYQLPVETGEGPLTCKGDGIQYLMSLDRPVSTNQPNFGPEDMADETEVPTSRHDNLKSEDSWQILRNPKR